MFVKNWIVINAIGRHIFFRYNGARTMGRPPFDSYFHGEFLSIFFFFKSIFFSRRARGIKRHERYLTRKIEKKSRKNWSFPSCAHEIKKSKKSLLTKTLVSNGRETNNVHLEWIFNEKNVNRKCYWERQSQCYIEDRALCQRKWEKTVTFTFLAWNKCTCQIQFSS